MSHPENTHCLYFDPVADSCQRAAENALPHRVKYGCRRAVYCAVPLMVLSGIYFPVDADSLATALTKDCSVSFCLDSLFIKSYPNHASADASVIINSTLDKTGAVMPGWHCPKKGGKRQKKPVQLDFAPEESAENTHANKEQKEPKTAKDWCLDFFADQDGFSSPINEKEWLDNALTDLYTALIDFLGTSESFGITENFLVVLTNSTRRQIANEHDFHASKSGSIKTYQLHGKDPEPSPGQLMIEYECQGVFDFLTAMQRMHQIINTQKVLSGYLPTRESSVYEVITPIKKYRGKHKNLNFLLRKLVRADGDVSLKIKGLIELLCLLLEPEIERKSADYLLGMLKEMQILNLKGGVYSVNKHFVPDVMKDTGKTFVRPDVLIRDMQNYFQQISPNPVIASSLLQIEFSLPQTARVKARKPSGSSSSAPSSTQAPLVTPAVTPSQTSFVQQPALKPSACKKKTATVKRSRQSSTSETNATPGTFFPLYSPMSTVVLEPIDQLRRAVYAGNAERAKEIYQQNKLEIEGKKAWRNLKKKLHDLLKKEPTLYGAFVDKHELGE